MWHLAQVNIGRLRSALDHPDVAEFVAALAPVNALADTSPGFVWRLQTDDGDATAVRVDDDPRVIVNLSVWESLEALQAFTFRSEHGTFLRRRREWFEHYGRAATALWWVPVGHVPDVREAAERLDALDTYGPTPQAFTFARTFGPPVG